MRTGLLRLVGIMMLVAAASQAAPPKAALLDLENQGQTVTNVAPAAPAMRVALLDFENRSGSKTDSQLGGGVDKDALAAKAADVLARQLLEQRQFRLIDRRDFIAKLQLTSPREALEGTPRPGVVQAAQLLGAQAVLGGSLTSFSTRKQKIEQGGHSAELSKLSMRVTVKAIDVVDGSVIAVAEGRAEEEFRQTPNLQTELGEEDAIQMLDQAIAAALPKLSAALAQHQAAGGKPRVTVNVDTTDNPALVEIDGVLVGTTPISGLQVYQGDHTLNVSRPGYEPMTRRLVLDRDMQISVPMLRKDLTVEERRAILDKAELKMYLMNGKPDILIQELKQ